jgi:hypothetical protein
MTKPETAATAKQPSRIITRREAKMRGRKTYFTGEPCQHGHICERFVKRAWCVECARLGKKPEPTATKTYFTGEPCKRGHVCERYVADGCCVECSKENFKKWQARNMTVSTAP